MIRGPARQTNRRRYRLNSELIRTKYYNLFRSPGRGLCASFLAPRDWCHAYAGISRGYPYSGTAAHSYNYTRATLRLFGPLSLPSLFRRDVTGAAWFPTSTVLAPWRAGRLSVCIMCGAGMYRAARASIVLVSRYSEMPFSIPRVLRMRARTSSRSGTSAGARRAENHLKEREPVWVGCWCKDKTRFSNMQ